MLVNTGSSIGQNAKQISLNSLGTTSAIILYTVPAGKKFIGYATASSMQSSFSYFNINGVSHNICTFYTNGGATAMSNQLILIAGTTVSSATTGASLSLIGIESDA